MSSTGMKINARYLRDEIVEALQRAIILGLVKPGSPLIERDWAEQFGISSIPVREAFQELESRGLVTRRPNRSCCVIELTQDELNQMFELRRLLEPQVIEWAAERITQDQAATLQPLVDDLQHAADEKDYAQFFYRDLCLHRRIWELSGNRYATQALARTVLPLFAFGLMRDHRADLIDLQDQVVKHRQMVDALRRKQGARASDVLSRIASGFEAHIRTDSTKTTAYQKLKGRIPARPRTSG